MRYILSFFILLCACSSYDRSIKVKGSDTEVNLAVTLAEHFYSVNPDFSVAISGGGSGLGIASLLNGQADIANSSRPLNAEEDSLFKVRKIALHTIVFAEDATAFIVHKKFPKDTLDIPSLAKILSGSYRTWKPVTGQEMPINIYGRQSNSGTHTFVQQKLGIHFSREAKEMNGNAQIMESIKLDRSGIGYVSAGYIAHVEKEQDVKVLYIRSSPKENAVSPLDEQAIKEKRYAFQRPLYQFIPSTSWDKVKTFIDFEKSEKGQAIIKASGYYITTR
ncbi:PstS family phosphate ABC transporter substrate-binding protein [Olivibacter sp. SDN3]|uniref:PstS family phosphate ABC transporter substrate-binding protein n=1 Tax=Olivibacter sp. SDN3 TaxID=2764720 RepID=UPI001650E709|nr:PstS family phosphate ABC transporter substrate-binding protein [Olivibacter sp. SDN3]QNL51053.1 PstS family phosphate ABC transporter substrate-binding protein [Olivibacter sp. SDN3]